jgi:multidrug resistance efflux pump
MPQSTAIVFPELHSEEVHEIISRPPHWLVRWGITLFFALLMVLVAGCWLIKYPDIVATPFTLTATDAPRTLMARSEGKLQRLLVRDGEAVQRGQILAYTESVADHEQVLLLGSDIEKFSHSIRRSQWTAVNDLHIRDYTQLGEIQTDFQGFTQKLSELKTFLNGGFYLQKRKLLLDDVNDLREMEKNLSEQLSLQKRDFDLGQEEFNVQEKLHRDKVIAPLEFKREKAKLLAREMPLKNLASALIQNRSSQTAKQKEILELDNAVSEQKNGFQQALQTLQSSVETWKQRFVLVAPVAGRVSYSAPWQEQQHLAAGQELLTVEPPGSNYQGLVKIPQANFGKLSVGQTVLIKLDGYPYREYGMVEGNLSRLSATPGRDSLYWGYVSLPHQLKTRYERELPYHNGLKGTAEIVTADRRLVERLVSTLRDGGK